MISIEPALLVLCSFILSACAVPTTDSVQIDSKGCRTVKKTLAITWKVGNPNGNAREMIYTNGQFPAPNLFFDEDDNVEITVINHMHFNTTIHWHGLLMQGTPWSDGVPGLSQKPIEPGGSYLYKFKAYPPGTYWYHSHSRASLLDGLYGGLFIRRKPGTPAPWSLISSDRKEVAAIAKAAHDPTLLVTSDWTNFTSTQYMQAQMESGLNIFCTDGILINGKGAVYCPPLNEMVGYAPEVVQPINDKGCLPFNEATQDQYYLTGRPELIPFGLQEGCVAANNTKDPMSIIKVDPADKWVSLNLVMASTLRLSYISIDFHEMWVYEVDGHYIEPRKVQSLSIYPGQRQAVMIKLDQKPSDYTIRVAGYPIGGVTSAYAVFSYKGGRPMKNYTLGYTIPSQQKSGWINYGGGNFTPNLVSFEGDQDHSPPFPPNPPAKPKVGDAVYVLDMGRFGSAWQWSLNGQSIMEVDSPANAPLLYNPSYPTAIRPDLVIRTNNDSWVDLVFQAGAPPGPLLEINHVIHKHASRFWKIGIGAGIFNWTSIAEAAAAQPELFNFVNPNLRDTAVTPFEQGWIAIRYHSANPGPWLLHCHVETHLAGGMAMVIMDGVDKWPKIPPEYAVDQHGFPVSHH